MLSEVRYIKKGLIFHEKVIQNFMKSEVDIDRDRAMIQYMLDIENICKKAVGMFSQTLKSMEKNEARKPMLDLIDITQDHQEKLQDMRWKLLVRDGLMDISA